MTEPNTRTGLNWLLDDLVRRTPQVRQAVLLSRDGLTVAASEGVSRERAEYLSALAAGVQSLARGAGRDLEGGDVRQTIIEMAAAFLFITAADEGSCLAVLSSAEADVGLVAYEMALLVKRVGIHFGTHPRNWPTESGGG